MSSPAQAGLETIEGRRDGAIHNELVTRRRTARTKSNIRASGVELTMTTTRQGHLVVQFQSIIGDLEAESSLFWLDFRKGAHLTRAP